MTNTVYFQAAADPDGLSTLKELFQNNNIDVNAIDPETNATALMIAVYHGNLEIVKYLVEEKRADILAVINGESKLAPGVSGKTAFFFSGLKGTPEVINYLWEKSKTLSTADYLFSYAETKAGLYHNAVSNGKNSLMLLEEANEFYMDAFILYQAIPNNFLSSFEINIRNHILDQKKQFLTLLASNAPHISSLKAKQIMIDSNRLINFNDSSSITNENYNWLLNLANLVGSSHSVSILIENHAFSVKMKLAQRENIDTRSERINFRKYISTRLTNFQKRNAFLSNQTPLQTALLAESRFWEIRLLELLTPAIISKNPQETIAGFSVQYKETLDLANSNPDDNSPLKKSIVMFCHMGLVRLSLLAAKMATDDNTRTIALTETIRQLNETKDAMVSLETEKYDCPSLINEYERCLDLLKTHHHPEEQNCLKSLIKSYQLLPIRSEKENKNLAKLLNDYGQLLLNNEDMLGSAKKRFEKGLEYIDKIPNNHMLKEDYRVKLSLLLNLTATGIDEEDIEKNSFDMLFCANKVYETSKEFDDVMNVIKAQNACMKYHADNWDSMEAKKILAKSNILFLEAIEKITPPVDEKIQNISTTLISMNSTITKYGLAANTKQSEFYDMIISLSSGNYDDMVIDLIPSYLDKILQSRNLSLESQQTTVLALAFLKLLFKMDPEQLADTPLEKCLEGKIRQNLEARMKTLEKGVTLQEQAARHGSTLEGFIQLVSQQEQEIKVLRKEVNDLKQTASKGKKRELSESQSHGMTFFSKEESSQSSKPRKQSAKRTKLSENSELEERQEEKSQTSTNTSSPLDSPRGKL